MHKTSQARCAQTQYGQAITEVGAETVCCLPQTLDLPFSVGELLNFSCGIHTHTCARTNTDTYTHRCITHTIRGRHVHTYKEKQL